MSTPEFLSLKPGIERTTENIRIVNILLRNGLATSQHPRASVTGNYTGLVIYWGTVAEMSSYELRELNNMGRKSFDRLMIWLAEVKQEYPEQLDLHAPPADGEAEAISLPDCPICKAFHENNHVALSPEKITVIVGGKTYRLVAE